MLNTVLWWRVRLWLFDFPPAWEMLPACKPLQKVKMLVSPPLEPQLSKIMDQGSSFTQMGMGKVHKEMLPEGFFGWFPIADVSPLSLVFTPDTVSLNYPLK